MLTKRSFRVKLNFAVEEQQRNVRVAQLDRASGYGPEGREFESCHVHAKSSRFSSAAFLFRFYIHFSHLIPDQDPDSDPD